MRCVLLVVVAIAVAVDVDYEYAPITAAMQHNAQSIIAAMSQDHFVFDHLAQLTDDFGPRFSGSNSLEHALDWIVTAATLDGGNGSLYNVTTEPVQVPAWSRGAEWAQLSTPTRNKTLHMVGLGMSNNTGGKVVTGAVLVVSSLAELLNVANESIGKVVLFDVPFTTYSETVQYRINAGVWAAQVGGVAALIRSVAPYSMQNPHTGSSVTAPVPAAAVSIEDATQMHRLFLRGVPMNVSLYMEMARLPDRLSRNVLLQIDGTEKPDEFVVFGGHSDSWDIAEGAMDDGGGIVAAWGAIHMIASLGIRTSRSVRAVMWVNEENGDQGGLAYAADHLNETNRTSIAFESDEGAFSPFTLAFTGHGAALNQLHLLKELVAPLGAGNVTTGGGGTDIDPLCRLGVPCASMPPRDPRATNYSNNPCNGVLSSTDFANGALGSPGGIPDGYFWFHHSAADTVDRMDPLQLQVYAAAMAIWAVAIADLPSLLPRTGSVPPLPPTPTESPTNLPTDPTESSPQSLVVATAIGFVAGLLFSVGVILLKQRLASRPARESLITSHSQEREYSVVEATLSS